MKQMDETTNESKSDARSRRSGRDAAIEAFLDQYADVADRDLLAEMIVTIARLARDGTGRGELKILNTALKELRYAFKVFAPYAETRKVSIFGSSRTQEHVAEYQAAVEFASKISKKNWMVITGAGDGIMRAGHGGAGREASFGVAIRLPMEQSANDIIAEDPKLVNFKYFFTRKLMFIKEASAIALFPGGFGTQDEGFESLTLVQTGKAELTPIVLVDAPGGSYWPHWREYVEGQLLNSSYINPEDLALIKITDNVDEAVEEIIHFYRVYHSSRFVRDQFVMRLNRPISSGLLERVNGEFADVLAAGKFEQADGPIDGEYGEHPEKARLIFAFNHQSTSRLRLLINELNDDA